MGIPAENAVGSKARRLADLWACGRRQGCLQARASPPSPKRAPMVGTRLPLQNESQLHPGQNPPPPPAPHLQLDRGDRRGHMAAEAPEDTRSQILAPGLGHLPAHLPRQPGPTVRHMPGAGPWVTAAGPRPAVHRPGWTPRPGPSSRDTPGGPSSTTRRGGRHQPAHTAEAPDGPVGPPSWALSA